MLKEFREFLSRGNVIDLAVAVIIGAAFSKIITSLVDDILMPLIGLVTAGKDISDLSIVLKPAIMEGTTIVSPEVLLFYGDFLQNIINFIIIGFCIFLIVKFANKTKAALNKEETKKATPQPTKEELLLTEIRDLLKKEKNN